MACFAAPGGKMMMLSLASRNRSEVVYSGGDRLRPRVDEEIGLMMSCSCCRPAPDGMRWVALSGLWLMMATLLLLFGKRQVAAAASAQAVAVTKVWDAAPYNAFTDLIWYKDRWFLVFREGADHSSMDGTIRVLASLDGVSWDSVARLAMPSVDLRDPKLSITPAGALMINAAQRTTGPTQYRSLYWTSSDGTTWSAASQIGEPDIWLWRVTWRDSTGYSVGYRTAAPYFTSLYSGNPEDGISFTAVISPLLSGEYVNETTLLFAPDDEALALTRRDPVAPYTSSLALLGSSAPPYTAWSWRETNLRLGGPDMLRLADGRIAVGARLYTPSVHTGLMWLDPGDATLAEFAELPSGGDTGYPGMEYRNGTLWVSYYSSHEGKASIYVGAVEIPLNTSHRVFLPMVRR